jgi:hypothetical protein
MRTAWIWAIALAVAVIIVGVGVYGARLIEHSLSARDQPTFVEDLVASKLRRAGIPATNRRHLEKISDTTRLNAKRPTMEYPRVPKLSLSLATVPQNHPSR